MLFYIYIIVLILGASRKSHYPSTVKIVWNLERNDIPNELIAKSYLFHKLQYLETCNFHEESCLFLFFSFFFILGPDITPKSAKYDYWIAAHAALIE